MGRRGLLALAGALLFFSCLAVAGLTLVNSPWHKIAPATCAPTNCFCEDLDDSLIRQPANTASSFAFVALGFLVAARPRTRWRSDSRMAGELSLLYGAVLALIGVGSALFHASLSFVGQTVDVMAVYLLISFLLVHNIARRRWIGPVGLLVLYVFGNALLLWLLIELPVLRRPVAAALAVLVLLFEAGWRLRGGVGQLQTLVAAVVLLLIGFAVWWADLTGLWCSPTSIIQGHALWHLLSASGAALAFVYLESTEPGAPHSD